MLLLLIACAGDPPIAASEGPPPALVRVAEVGPGELEEAWTTVGEVRALGAAELAAGAAGSVTRVAVREGDQVERGALLLEVDAALAGARLVSAQASAAEVRAELERLRGALDRRERVREGVLAAEELQDARAAVAVAEARAAAMDATALEAGAALALHRVRAPFDGVITARAVDPGDWVTAGQPVLDLVAQGVEVRARVPRSLASRLAQGDAVSVAGGDGAILAVVPTLDPDTRTALVRIQPGGGLSLAAGEAVEVLLPVSWEGVGVTVPRDALLLDPRSARVLAVSDGAARSVEVEVLATTDTLALVVSDALATGDRVITRGNERVRDGQSVRVEDGQ